MCNYYQPITIFLALIENFDEASKNETTAEPATPAETTDSTTKPADTAPTEVVTPEQASSEVE